MELKQYQKEAVEELVTLNPQLIVPKRFKIKGKYLSVKLL